jgi:hypothetical protein
MNIKQAKDQIKYAAKSYLTKDENGEYIIPIEKQRPLFLMGPPGVGKTAIMEQVASELGIGLVTYSMTHHTRQSALGLPFIVQKTYGGKEYSVSEYTMSEIIASVYDRIENDGVKEGLLFLDEINCVSETLAPSMLQFLQYKIFGTHRVPEGWIVVTAGNPPEYNNSVREFDIVTWDRLKRIDVEPDLDVWKEYAFSRAVHPAIITYLDIRKNDFYSIETTVDGKRFVTARGWEDLSDMIKLFEQNGFRVDETLIIQYLQKPSIAKDFAVYYDLFRKYRSDYKINTILDGTVSDEIIARAGDAKFDERLSLLGLIFDALCGETRKVAACEDELTVLMNMIKEHKEGIIDGSSDDATALLRTNAEDLKSEAAKGKNSGALSSDAIKAKISASKTLSDMADRIELAASSKGQDAFDVIKRVFDGKKDILQKNSEKAKDHMNNALGFCEKAFGLGQEIVLLVTEMTAENSCARFISRYGCEQYYRFNKDLLFNERQTELLREIDEILI